jgi:CelD/BcsL family acetyltransferase involved in cellulose biosynthesis
MKMQEINNFNDFRSIKTEWNNLLNASKDRNIFLTWDWNYIWYKHFHANKELSLLIFIDGSEIQGIIPLIRRKLTFRMINYTIFENMGIPNSDYGGIIVSDNCKEVTQIFDLFAKFIKNNKLLVRMDEIPENIKIYKELNNRLSANDISIFVKQQPLSYCPYLSLEGSWEEYRRKLNRKFRKDIERNARKFERENGKIHFRKSSSIEELENDFNIFLNLQRKKRDNKGYPQIKNQEECFLFDIVKNFFANNWLNLSFLEVDGIAISSSLAFEYNNIYYYYLNAFDPSYHSYSIGKVHNFYILNDLFNRGLSELDFMRGDEAYKSIWTPSRRINERIIAYAKCSGLNIELNFITILAKHKYKYILWQDLRTTQFQDSQR